MRLRLTRILSGLLAIVLLLASVVVPLIPDSVVMATTSTFYPDAHPETSSVDGYIFRGIQGTWSEVRTGAGTQAVDDATTSGIGLSSGTESPKYVSLRRGCVFFETSALPDNAVITSATLSLYGESKVDDNNWQPNINVYNVITGSNTSLSTADYLYTNYGSTAYSTSITYNGWSTSGYNDFELNSTGRAAISLTGITKFGIRNANYDVANNAPGWGGWLTPSRLNWYSAEQGAGYKPKLAVTYYIITSPEITADNASSIAQTTARLNSTLDNDGNDTCEVRFGYGETSQTAGNFANYDTITSWVDGYTSGEHPYVDVSSLTANTTYYYRVQAKNDAGTTTSSNEITFDTEASLNEPSNFRAIPTATTIALSWTKGTGASTTLVRYKFDAYPTTTSDGTELYSGTGSSTTHTGLSTGTTIYYSAWGESGGSYSASYTTLLITTLAGSDVDVDIAAPVEPTNWFLDVDYTTQSNMPFYSTINNIADSVNVPRSTAWMMSGMFVATVGAFAIYRWKKSLLGASLVLMVLLGLVSAQKLIPLFVVFLVGIVIVGVALTQRRLVS
jgi:hypothetical protein